MRVTIWLMVTVLGACGARADSAFEARGAGSSFVADDARPLSHLGHAGQLRFVWGKDPIVRRGKDGRVIESVVEHQLDAQLVVGLGLFDRLELGAQLSGRAQLAPGGAFDDLSTSLPPPRLFARVLLVDTGLFQAALRVRGALLESIEPGLIVAVDPKWARFTFDTGAAITPGASSTRIVTLPFALNATVPVHERLALTLDAFGAVTAERVALEAMAGARVDLGIVDVVAGVGGGLLADVGTPALRVTTAVLWRFDPVAPVVVAAQLDEPLVIVSGADEPEIFVEVPELLADEAPPDSEGADAPEVFVDDSGVTFADHVVLFAVDSDKLLPAGRRLLGVVAARIKEHPEATHIVVSGHADASGDSDFNRRLSSWRAHAVRRSLIAWGVSADRLIVRAAGSSQPVASNATAAGRRQNRRAEITFETASETP